jgi:hypothetical protein
MGILKFIVGLLSIAAGAYIAQKGFHMPNHSAADICFGIGFLFSFLGFILWIN